MALIFDSLVAEEKLGSGNTGGKSINGPKKGATEERIR